jgi:hypothetical protein
VGLDAEVNIKMLNQSKQLSGNILVISAITYRRDTEQVFLSNPEINKLEIQGIPQQYHDDVIIFISKAVLVYLQEFPVYTLTAKDMKTAVAMLFLKDVQAKSNEVQISFGL